MKRIGLVLAMLVTTTMLAQGQTKQLVGKWLLDVEKSGTKNAPPTMVIETTDKDLKVTLGDDKRTQTMIFKLDGTEMEMANQRKTAMAWKGNKLEATVIDARGRSSVLFSREGDWLVQEGVSPEGPTKIYFKKASAK